MRRLKELDVLKGLAITAVIAIHTTSDGLIKFDVSSYSYMVYLFINRLSQFAVPAFIFASSLLLSYVYRERFRTITIRHLKNFYLKRLMRIIPPYMSWTFIYLLTKYVITGGATPLTIHNYLKYIITGNGYYHLYFVIIILQLYLFMPFIVFLISHVKIKFCHMLLISALIQILFYYVYQSYIVHYFQRSAVLVAWYILLVFTGSWIGINYEAYTRKEKYIATCLPVAIVSGVSYIYLYHLLNLSIYVPLSVFNLVWYIYVTSAALSLLYISKRLRIRSLESAGRLSFGIYLIHPLLLSIMNGIYNTGNIMMYHLYTLFEFLTIYAVSYIITAALENTAWSKYIVG